MPREVAWHVLSAVCSGCNCNPVLPLSQQPVQRNCRNSTRLPADNGGRQLLSDDWGEVLVCGSFQLPHLYLLSSSFLHPLYLICYGWETITDSVCPLFPFLFHCFDRTPSWVCCTGPTHSSSFCCGFSHLSIFADVHWPGFSEQFSESPAAFGTTFESQAASGKPEKAPWRG